MNSSGLKNRVLVFVGPPGIGKSTYVKHLNPTSSYTICSSDDYIEAYAKSVGKTYNEVFAEVISDADKHFFESYDKALAANDRMIVLDRTNLTIKGRKRLIEWAKKHDYSVEAVLFKNVFWTKWAEQLRGRKDKSIPAHVIGSMILNYDEPTRDEGFDDVFYI